MRHLIYIVLVAGLITGCMPSYSDYLEEEYSKDKYHPEYEFDEPDVKEPAVNYNYDEIKGTGSYQTTENLLKKKWRL